MAALNRFSISSGPSRPPVAEALFEHAPPHHGGKNENHQGVGILISHLKRGPCTSDFKQYVMSGGEHIEARMFRCSVILAMHLRIFKEIVAIEQAEKTPPA